MALISTLKLCLENRCKLHHKLLQKKFYRTGSCLSCFQDFGRGKSRPRSPQSPPVDLRDYKLQPTVPWMFTTDCHFKNTLNLKKNKYYFSHNQKMVKDVFGKQEILLNSKLNSNITFLRFCFILVIRKLIKTQKLLILKQTYQNKQTKKI